jgi:hypothetical protein
VFGTLYNIFIKRKNGIEAIPLTTTIITILLKVPSCYYITLNLGINYKKTFNETWVEFEQSLTFSL